MNPQAAPRRRIVVVTGLSGAGKATVLRTLEDLGYEAVDNPPLPMLEDMVRRSDRSLAIGVDARTSGFDASGVLGTLDRLRDNPGLLPELVYVWADDTTLLRRYTESRRRHPLAPQGIVAEGIAAEEALTAILRAEADLMIDTSDLPVTSLRRMIEDHYGANPSGQLGLSLMSFAFPRGIPREADLVFDARFLRNPHYDPILRPLTGLAPEVGAYVEADPDCGRYFERIVNLVDLILPRFVQEGKKYATITIGCTGGRHRSVYLVEKLAAHLRAWMPVSDKAGAGAAPAEAPADSRTEAKWRLHVSHRELERELAAATRHPDYPAPRRGGVSLGTGARSAPVQAQEA
jgi:UPF0042 nucleotide-binding protein